MRRTYCPETAVPERRSSPIARLNKPSSKAATMISGPLRRSDFWQMSPSGPSCSGLGVSGVNVRRANMSRGSCPPSILEYLLPSARRDRRYSANSHLRWCPLCPKSPCFRTCATQDEAYFRIRGMSILFLSVVPRLKNSSTAHITCWMADAISLGCPEATAFSCL